MVNILIVTDAWTPQANGVVSTIKTIEKEGRERGDVIDIYHHERCKIKFPVPFYKEVLLAFPSRKQIKTFLKTKRYKYIFIVTPEGPICSAFIKTCKNLKIPFSTTFCTLFPIFVKKMMPLISMEDSVWNYSRNAYKGSSTILCSTNSLAQLLKRKGFTEDMKIIYSGVDTDLFKPNPTRTNKSTKVLLCVSRVSWEKGLDDFCSLEYPNSIKILVGDGPYLKTLQKKYPMVRFIGKKPRHELVAYYQEADVFVFPSNGFDTFGVVQLEAMACGTPVAAYPVMGPIDVIQQGINGFMANDLTDAVRACLKIKREDVHLLSKNWSVENFYDKFIDGLKPQG